jgi:hypothetical protein
MDGETFEGETTLIEDPEEGILKLHCHGTLEFSRALSTAPPTTVKAMVGMEEVDLPEAAVQEDPAFLPLQGVLHRKDLREDMCPQGRGKDQGHRCLCPGFPGAEIGLPIQECSIRV